MKIQCDVCSRDEASVFCCADEAALCHACDRGVHHANKLASKHRRFSLSSPTETHSLCDICKERRGFVFCQEDRAILCTDCDVPIHTANELTMKHNRFLLPGSKLQEIVEPNNNRNSNSINSKSPEKTQELTTSNGNRSSSISEYLTKMLPGYPVDDFLADNEDRSYKSDKVMPCSDEFPIWVPQVPQFQPLDFLFNDVNGSIPYNQSQSFMVPQINVSVSTNKKRPRDSFSAWDFAS